MTQTPHDQLAKQYLEEFLAPFGRIERQYEIPGEAKYVDVWFVPDESSIEQSSELGILGRMTEGMCLLEPYRNAPTRNEVRTSILKLLWVQDAEQRKAKQLGITLAEDALPKLWILASTVSAPLIEEAGGLLKSNWLPGIYCMADLLKVGIVAIDQLPETPDTLWLRILGRDDTQKKAIQSVLAMPDAQPKRDAILQLLASWKVRMDMSELTDYLSQEEIMALSDVLIERDKQKDLESRQAERQAIAQKLLRRGMPLEEVSEITDLSIAQIQQLRATLELE